MPHYFRHCYPFRALGVFAIASFLALAVHGQEQAKTQATPKAAATESFEAFKRGDLAKFVSLFHPEETKRFKAFAVDVFKEKMPDEQTQEIRKLFTPFDSAEQIEKASGSDLISALTKNSLDQIDVKELLKDVELKILGEIKEGETVHVITRTVLPRPSPLSCKKNGDDWCLMLNDETVRLMTQVVRNEKLRKKGIPITDFVKKLKMEKVEVVGYVNDGDDLAQALCRVTNKMEDIEMPVFACYPVRKGEQAWDHLKDKKKLAEALQAKWTRQPLPFSLPQ